MSPVKVLIVEDEAILALELERELRNLGYEVTDSVASAAAAINSIKTQRPDVVLMDIWLGDSEDGIRAAGEIYDGWQIPAIFMTSITDSAVLARAKEVHPVGYLHKPIRSNDLKTNLELGLHKHRDQRRAARHQRFIESILNQVQEGVCIFDDKLGLVFANNPARRILAIDEIAVGGQSRQFRPEDIFRLMEASTLLPIGVEEVFAPLPPALPRIFDDLLIERPDGRLLNISLRVSQIPSERGAEASWMLSFLDISAQKDLAHSIEYQAKHDALTNLPNRELFVSILSRTLQSEANLQLHALALVNLDKFRLLNEVCGQMEGDAVLRSIARDLEHVPTVDTVSRIANDEFALILNLGSNNIEEVLEELRALCDRKLQTGSDSFPLSASIGAVSLDTDIRDSAILLSNARDACMLAKLEGGNRFHITRANKEQASATRGEVYWVNQLMTALEEERFLLYFQRIQGLRESLHPKVEILLRLRNSSGDIVSPNQFLGTAERYRLMSRIDLFVLQQSIEYLNGMAGNSGVIELDGGTGAPLAQRAAAAQTDASLAGTHAASTRVPPITLNVNLSGSTIQDQAALGQILDILAANPAAARRLCLEITETSAIQHFDRVIEFMHRAIELGATFALDDFGNGFSSFAYLKKLPVSTLKIDGSFVRDMTDSSTSRAMVAAINKLGHELGLSTVAEFVSSREILEEVRKLGVDYAQGYVIQEPEPLE